MQIGQVLISTLSEDQKMITSKAQMLRVMKNCDGADTLTREEKFQVFVNVCDNICLLYTSPSPRDVEESRMPSSA